MKSFLLACYSIAFSVSAFALSIDDDVPVRIEMGKEINPVWYVGSFEKDPIRSIPIEGENAEGGRYSVKQVGTYKGYNLNNISTENCDSRGTRNRYESEQELSAKGEKENSDEIAKKNVRGRKWKKVQNPPSQCRGRDFEYLEMLEPFGPRTTTIQMCFYKGIAQGKSFWITRDYDGLELSRKELVYKEGILQSSIETATAKRIKIREKQIQAIQSNRKPVYKVTEYLCKPRWRKITKKWIDDGTKKVLQVTIADPLGKSTALIPVEDVYRQAQEREEKATRVSGGSSSGSRELLPGTKNRGTR